MKSLHRLADDKLRRDASCYVDDNDVYTNARRRAVEHVVREGDDPSEEFQTMWGSTSGSSYPPKVDMYDANGAKRHHQDDEIVSDDRKKPACWQEERLVNPLSKGAYIEEGTWTMENLELGTSVSHEVSAQMEPQIPDFRRSERTSALMEASSQPGAIRVRPSQVRGVEDDEGEAFDPAETPGRRRSSVLSSLLNGINPRSLVQAFVVEPDDKDGEGNDDQDDGSKVLAEAEPLNTRAQICRRRLVACVLLVVFVGTTVLVLVIVSQLRDSRNQSPPSSAPSLFPSSSPSYSSNGLLSFLAESSWDGGVALRDPGSPQYEAANWMLSHAGGDLLASYSAARVLQRYIMACIYFALGGPTWLNNSNWIDMQVDECKWFLESANPCNDEGEVTDIVLRQNLLRGSIPPEFTLLPVIKVFDISSNDVSGTIPSEIGLMHKLEALVLGANELSGDLPRDFAFMPSLRLLDTSNNKLACPEPWRVPLSTLEPAYEEKVDPDQIISKLVVLDNANNPGTAPPGFGCAFPGIIGYFTNLEKIDFSGSYVVGSIPSLLGLLSRLQRFALPDQLSMIGNVPTELAGMERLVNLDMTRTFRLETRRQIPTIVGNLKSLEELRAASLAFDGTIPTEIGMLAHKLLMLDFSNSSIHGKIPTQIGRLTALRELNMGGTALSGMLPSELGLLGNRLRHLDLHGNGTGEEVALNTTRIAPALSGPIPLELALLSRLTHMDLSFTSVSGEWPTRLNRLQLSALQVLKLESTNLFGSITELVCDTSGEGEDSLLVEEVRIGNTTLECVCCAP